MHKAGNADNAFLFGGCNYVFHLKLMSALNSVTQPKLARSVLCSAFHYMSKISKLTEDEHYPDIDLMQYRSVEVDLEIHGIHRLSENTFISASEFDAIVSEY